MTSETAVTPAVTKSLYFITLAPVCLTLFLAFAAVTPILQFCEITRASFQ